MWDRCRLQRLDDGTQAGPGAGEDRDIFQTCRTRSVPVAHQPALVLHLLQQSDDRLGLLGADLRRLGLSWTADPIHGGRVHQRWAISGECLIRCLAVASGGMQADGEQRVHPLDDSRNRSKVLRQLNERVREAFAYAAVEVDVRTPEAVDRLLGVTDEEQTPFVDGQGDPIVVRRPRGGAAEQKGNLSLNRIGVLELIDEDVRVSLSERCPYLRALRQHVAREHQ